MLLKTRGRAGAEKLFYVSPFIDHQAKFLFKFDEPGDALTASIKSKHHEELELSASLSTERLELNDRNLLYLSLIMPLVTLKTIILIHYQALKIYLKKVPYFKKDETDQKISAIIERQKELIK